jgi:hypothetical protein
MGACAWECLEVDMAVSASDGGTLRTHAEVVHRDGPEILRRCLGCRTICATFELPGMVPEYSTAVDQVGLRAACQVPAV